MIVTATVIMPYFRKKKFFKAAYLSVLNQTYKDIEIIVIYDDENLSELDYVKKIIKNRKNTFLIINNKNFGAGFSRNIGIKKAKGKYISFLDCDDVWKSNKLEFQINFMMYYNLDITYTSYSVINKYGKNLYNVFSKEEMVYKDFLKSCDIGLSTVVIKKTILNNFKFSRLKTKEDYLLWLQLSKSNFKFKGIKKILSYWRVTKNSLSNNIFQKIIDSFVIFYHFERQSFLKTIVSILVLSFLSFKKNKFLKI